MLTKEGKQIIKIEDQGMQLEIFYFGNQQL